MKSEVWSQNLKKVLNFQFQAPLLTFPLNCIRNVTRHRSHVWFGPIFFLRQTNELWHKFLARLNLANESTPPRIILENKHIKSRLFVNYQSKSRTNNIDQITTHQHFISIYMHKPLFFLHSAAHHHLSVHRHNY